MSHGDGRDRFMSEKENLQSMRRKRKLGTDVFAQAIARTVVAQVCESLGFQSFHQSALDNFADVAVKYIQEIGKTASSYANLANRNQCNVFDVIQGLDNLSSAQGFSGASDVRHSLSGSGVVKDIIRYVGIEEIPFAFTVPVFPVVKERIWDRSFAQAEETPPDEHIPSWLPKFPDPATYAELSSGNEKDTETEVVKENQQVEQQHMKAERSWLNLHRKLICNGSEAGVVVEHGDAAKAQRAAENNPFLAPPLQPWEKEVSLPILPATLVEESLAYHQSHEVTENHVSALEPSSQANEVSKIGPHEREGRREIPLSGRPNVHFKVGNVKKSFRMVTNPQNEGTMQTSLWFGDDHDDGAGEKKGRAEEILLENNPPELSSM